jgi:hypothetical protein
VSLTVPDADSLLLHMHREDPFVGAEEDWADDALQRATDLLWMATGIEDDPTDDRVLRIETVAILAMAHALYVSGGEDRDAMYSPFSSERLGSYSYSKMLAAVQNKQETGVPEFDLFVKWFLSQLNADGIYPGFQTTSEKVFDGPYEDLLARERSLNLSMDALQDEFGR